MSKKNKGTNNKRGGMKKSQTETRTENNSEKCGR